MADNVKIESQFEGLKAALIRDKFLPSPSSSDTTFCSSDLKWCFAGYNPPFTIPYFRRNEIWIDLDNYSKDEEYQNHLNQQRGAYKKIKDSFIKSSSCKGYQRLSSFTNIIILKWNFRMPTSTYGS